MNYLLLFISVVTDTLRNMYNNHFSKELMKTSRDAVMFNAICGIGAVVFFICSGAEWKISGFSMGIALCFAAVTAAAQFLSLAALAAGPMSYSVLFTYLGMVIPTIFGVIVYKQPLSTMQVIGFVLMLVTIFLSVDLKKDSKMSIKWFAYAMGSFVMWGLVGVFQLIHQESEHAGEINGFLMYSFIIMTAIFLIALLVMPKPAGHSFGYMNGKITALILVSGLILGIVNKINLYLSGAMPSIIFFPIVNGGVIILAELAAIFVFRERPGKKQIAGIVAGIAATCLLGI